jgi:penicillin-binding protein 1A
MSIALGNLGLSPLKMAQIFSVFANKGHMIEPRLVSKIISKEGAVIYETRPKEIADFTTPEQAYLMTDILKDVVKRGTGRNAQVKGIELAGKTGTTNKNVDAWFCGYSPTVETIVWFGRDNNRPIGRGATGGATAAPAFAYYYRELLKQYPDIKRTFDIPEGVFIGEYKGKKELYTQISPLPKIKTQTDEFDVPETTPGYHIDDDGYMISDVDDESISTEDQMTIQENEGDIGYAQTVNIDEDPEADIDEADPLHPPRIAPETPASEDSGTLF